MNDKELDKEILKIINGRDGKIITRNDLYNKLLGLCRQRGIEVEGEHREKLNRWFTQRLRILEEKELIQRKDQLPDIYFMLRQKGEERFFSKNERILIFLKRHLGIIALIFSIVATILSIISFFRTI